LFVHVTVSPTFAFTVPGVKQNEDVPQFGVPSIDTLSVAADAVNGIASATTAAAATLRSRLMKR
jgi:hypothetical protein